MPAGTAPPTSAASSRTPTSRAAEPRMYLCPRRTWALRWRRSSGMRERKRRMDWSEYLDDPGEGDGGGGGSDDGAEEARDEGIEVTTELPEQRPKVISLKKPPKAQMGLAGKRPKPSVNPTLSKRQFVEEGSPPCPTAATSEAQIPKWSNHLDTSFFEEKGGFDDTGQHCTELECFTTDVVVDDE
ncbi:hypothetical protein ABZP36_016058 [Zizania latifolia]